MKEMVTLNREEQKRLVGVGVPSFLVPPTMRDFLLSPMVV